MSQSSNIFPMFSLASSFLQVGTCCSFSRQLKASRSKQMGLSQQKPSNLVVFLLFPFKKVQTQGAFCHTDRPNREPSAGSWAVSVKRIQGLELSSACAKFDTAISVRLLGAMRREMEMETETGQNGCLSKVSFSPWFKGKPQKTNTETQFSWRCWCDPLTWP